MRRLKRHHKNTLRLVGILAIALAIASTVKLATNYVPFVNKAYMEVTGVRANLTINFGRQGTFTPHWKYLAQGGEEKSGLQAVIKNVQKLEPTYIRIDHVYDFYDPVKKDANGYLVFDWVNLDKEIKVIESMGARPFLALSYMPKALSKSNELDLPYSWDEWKLVVQRTIEHVSGISELGIAGVYYEIWNEPDLFGNFKTTGSKNYLTLYDYAEKGAREARGVLPFKIGGPATTAFYRNWFTDFFTYAQRNNLRVDFYSWHIYSKNISSFEDSLQMAGELLKRYPRYLNTQFVISESGFTSENDPGYDTFFGAIHALSMFATTFQKNAMIFTFEIKDGLGQGKYWGRWGILTHEKFGVPAEKPRFAAIEFLNAMTGKWLDLRGQGSWVKAFATYRKDEKTLRLLVTNYDPYGTHRESVPITFTNLPSQKVRVKRVDFLGQTKELSIEIQEGVLKTEQLFEPNSAGIFEIILD